MDNSPCAIVNHGVFSRLGNRTPLKASEPLRLFAKACGVPPAQLIKESPNGQIHRAYKLDGDKDMVKWMLNWDDSSVTAVKQGDFNPMPGVLI